MQYGSAGAGSATHLGCVLLNYLIGVDITHVPYRGTGPAMQDLQGGRIDYLCEIVSTAKPQIDGGTVKRDRDHDQGALEGAAEPADRPRAGHAEPRSLYLERHLPARRARPPMWSRSSTMPSVQAMKTPAVRERLEGLGAVIVPDDRATPEYLGQFVKSEIEKWAAPIKASGVSVD